MCTRRRGTVVKFSRRESGIPYTEDEDEEVNLLLQPRGKNPLDGRGTMKDLLASVDPSETPTASQEGDQSTKVLRTGSATYGRSVERMRGL